MALLPSFKSELIAFRKRLDAFEAELSRKQKGHWKYTLAIEVLDRWQVSGDCEPIWKTLRLKLRCMPAEFIGQILWRRYLAEEVAQRLTGWSALESKVLARAKRHIKQKDFAQAAEVSLLAHAFTTARRGFSQKTKTAARQAFIKGLSCVLQEKCGQPFDWAVAALTEISFGETITTGMVRNIRQQKA